MKRALLILFVCLGFCKAEGQDLDDEITAAMDSLLYHIDSVTASKLSDERYWAVDDSITNAIVAKHVKKRTSKGEYSWPYWWYRKDYNNIFYPDDNYSWLLLHKYNIDMWYPLSGCRKQRAFDAYDSMMRDEILIKYGADFFERTKEEAERLAKKGEGLTIPYIGSKQNTLSILTEIRANDTLGREAKFIVIAFSGDTVKRAYWAHHGMPGSRWTIQGTLGDRNPSGGDDYELKKLLTKYRWTGPRFMKKPVKHTMYYNFESRTFAFMEYH